MAKRKYFTEEERKAGAVQRVLAHRARNRDNPVFIAQQKAIEARRYAKNREKRIAATLEWQKKNPDKVRAKYREWCDANRDHVRAYNREYQKQWVALNPEKRQAAQQRSRVGRRSGSHFTPEEWALRLDEFGHRCAFCLTGGKMTVEHVESINRGGHNGIDNIIPSCGSCNSRKQDRGMLYMATRI